MNPSSSATWGNKLLVLAVLVASALLARAQDPKLSPDLQTMGSGSATNVIVQYYHDPSADDAPAATAAGAKNGKALGHIKAALYTMSPGQAKKLASNSNLK